MEKIVTDPKIMLGKPTIAGTRITVEQVLQLLSQKLSIRAVHKDFPQLTEADIKTAVTYVAKKVADPSPKAIRYLHEIHR